MHQNVPSTNPITPPPILRLQEFLDFFVGDLQVYLADLRSVAQGVGERLGIADLIVEPLQVAAHSRDERRLPALRVRLEKGKIVQAGEDVLGIVDAYVAASGGEPRVREPAKG